MNLNSTDEKHQIFENNIKKEPEEEFLCILPSFDTENAHEGNLMEIKQEKEICVSPVSFWTIEHNIFILNDTSIVTDS